MNSDLLINKSDEELKDIERDFVSFFVSCLEFKLDSDDIWFEESFLDRESNGLLLYKYLVNRGIDCTFYFDELQDGSRELFLQVSIGDVGYEELLGAFRGALLSFEDDSSPPEVNVGIAAKFNVRGSTFTNDYLLPASIIYKLGSNENHQFVVKSVNSDKGIVYLGLIDGEITRPDLFVDKHLKALSGDYAVSGRFVSKNESANKKAGEILDSEEEFTVELDFLNAKDINESLVEPYVKK